MTHERIKIGENIIVTTDVFEPPLVSEPVITLSFWPVNMPNPMPGFNVSLPAANWCEFRDFIMGVKVPDGR